MYYAKIHAIYYLEKICDPRKSVTNKITRSLNIFVDKNLILIYHIKKYIIFFVNKNNV